MKPKLYTCTIPLNNQNLNVVFIYMYSFQNTGIHVMKYISEQGTDCYITKFYQSLFFFFTFTTQLLLKSTNSSFLNTCTYIINSSIIFILNGMDLALVFGIKKKKLLHYTTCTFSGVKNTVLKTTMILIKNHYNQMYKLTCTCTKEM